MKDPAKFRENVRERLQVHVPNGTNLEVGIFNKTIKVCTADGILKKWSNPQFVRVYTAELKTVMFNLETNPELRARIAESATPQDLAFMTHPEMNPEMWKTLVEQKAKRDQSLTSPTLTSSTDLYVCGKCRKRECTYYQLQTRSSDEPITTFITCINCGKCWTC